MFMTPQQVVVSERTVNWDYDAADRVILETVNDLDNGNYALSWMYDLTGNRIAQDKTTSAGRDSTQYTYDANDRLTAETMAHDGVLASTVRYDYDQTQQTSKMTLDAAGQTTKTVTYQYNLQGRMSQVTTTIVEAAGNSVSTVTYEYDSAGNRVASQSTNAGVSRRIEYLTDQQNHTGYSQVLQETEFAQDAAGQFNTPTRKVVYTIGHDQISQTQYTPSPTGEGWGEETSTYFGSDGHGSVRVLYDALGVIANDIQNNLLQLYHFDAYGNLLNFADGTQPLTTYLYSGESFDFRIGQQYLRARWYDATTGRFNRLDPFAGNSQDPQSFHKYAYVHGDPVQRVDPTGMFFSLAGFLSSSSIQGQLRGGSLGSTLHALKTTQSLVKLTRIYSKIIRVADRIDDAADLVLTVLDWLQFDWNDLRNITSNLSGMKSFAQRLPVSGFVKAEFMLPRSIGEKLSFLSRWLGGSNTGQEIIGEIGTALVAYQFGFQPTFIRFNSVHGPDQVSRHTRSGRWAIIEAKGGKKARLLRGSRAASYGDEMGGPWITYSIKEIVRKNPNSSAAVDLARAYAANEKMLALVTRIVGEGKRFHVKIGAQVYNPPNGTNLVSWGRGF